MRQTKKKNLQDPWNSTFFPFSDILSSFFREKVLCEWKKRGNDRSSDRRTLSKLLLSHLSQRKMSFGDIQGSKNAVNKQTTTSSFGQMNSQSEKDPVSNLRESIAALQVDNNHSR